MTPFGGVGQSGFGAYHGKTGFDEFLHQRTILQRTTLIPQAATLPTPLHPVNNQYPWYVVPFLHHMFITGIFDKAIGATTKVSKASIAAAAAYVAYKVYPQLSISMF
jgi:hypothetical protein